MKLEKITEDGSRWKRRYDDACAAAHGLDLLGERWALLVVRELMLGPRRFRDLKANLPGISANVLTQRLEGLEAIGVLVRRKLPPPASVMAYELTEWGYEAEPIFQALGRWAARSPLHDPTLPFSAASLVLSLRTMFDAARGEGFKKRVGLRIEGHDFVARVRKGRLFVEPGDLDGVDATLDGSPRVIAAVIYGGRPAEELEAEGLLAVSGERSALDRFARLFPLPEKAPTR